MVRVVSSPKDLRGLGYADIMEGIEGVSVILPVSMMPNRTAFLVSIRWRGGPDSNGLTRTGFIDKVVDLGPALEGRMYLVFGKEDPFFFEMLRIFAEEFRVFMDWPVILNRDSIRIGWIGTLENVSKILGIYKDLGIEPQIESIRDYGPAGSGYTELTGRQARFLRIGYERGLFDNPRKVTIGELAKGEGVSPASFMKTLRRAQHKVIGAYFRL